MVFNRQLFCIAFVMLLGASPVQTQLEAMNDADCVATKAGDVASFARTLAPEYREIDVDGTVSNRTTALAGLKSMIGRVTVTSCSTKVSKVTLVGTHYELTGIYTEAGLEGPKHLPFRLVERIRDTWRRAGGVWLQTESVTYEMTAWVSGKLAGHQVKKGR
jgi:hypothetical protein